jgi:hypothetical protein
MIQISITKVRRKFFIEHFRVFTSSFLDDDNNMSDDQSDNDEEDDDKGTFIMSSH